jgi:hypothetical protein
VPTIAGVFPVWLWVLATMLQVAVYSGLAAAAGGAVRDLTRRA